MDEIMSVTKEFLPVEEQMAPPVVEMAAAPYDWEAEEDFAAVHREESGTTPVEVTAAQPEAEIKDEARESSRFTNVIQAIRALPEHLDRKTRRIATVAATIGVLLAAAPVASAEGKTHKVKTGDDMTQIAEKNHITLSTLIKRNPQIQNPNLIFPGQKIFIRKDRATKPAAKKADPAPKVVAAAPAAKAAAADTAVKTASPVFKASELADVPRAPKALEAESTPVPLQPSEAIRAAQDELFAELERAAEAPVQTVEETPAAATETAPTTEVETVDPLAITEPVRDLRAALAKARKKAETPKPKKESDAVDDFEAKTREAAGIKWSWPVSKDLGVNSCWHEPRPGHLHAGYDIAGPMGTPVRAAAKGVVVFALNDTQPIQGYGNGVFIRHTGENGAVRYSLSAHLSSFAEGIKAGTKVKRGQIIGAMGDTASPGAVHLHFNMQSDSNAAGSTENPATYLPDDGRAGFDGCK